jgi:hypothetical protein
MGVYEREGGVTMLHVAMALSGLDGVVQQARWGGLGIELGWLKKFNTLYLLST